MAMGSNAFRKLRAFPVAIAMLCALLVAMPTESAYASQQLIHTPSQEPSDSCVVQEDDATQDELFEGYIEQRLAESLASSSESLDDESNLYPMSIALSGNEETVYVALQSAIKEIASGARDDTRINIPLRNLVNQSTWSAEELGVETVVKESEDLVVINEEVGQALQELVSYDHRLVLNSLLANCPYELYWFDKTSESYFLNDFEYYAEFNDGEWMIVIPDDACICVMLPVAADYALGSDYRVDTSKGQRVEEAIQTAQTIVQQGSDMGLYARLHHYAVTICGLTAYDHDAASGGVGYGDPWQLISVFDGDDSTNVVCEGYAKAFKYLCDLTSIDGFRCTLVSGVMTGGVGEGPHMWNVVLMPDGRNYLVDVTNCDEGSVGADDMLMVVAPSSGSVSDGYRFDVSGQELQYRYDTATLDTFGEEELVLSDTAYAGGGDDGPNNPFPSASWERIGTCEWTVADGTLVIRPFGNGSSGLLPDLTANTVPWKSQAESIVAAKVCDGVRSNEKLSGMFSDLPNLKRVEFGDFDTSSARRMTSMFHGCSSLKSLDLSCFDTSHVEDMSTMFYGCSALEHIDVSSFDTSNVTGNASDPWSSGMANMFSGCSSLEELDLSSFDTSNVRNMTSMFHGCAKLSSLDVSGFDTSSIGLTDSSEEYDFSFGMDLFGMFNGCESLTEVDISGWNLQNVRDMGQMFYQSGITSFSAYDTYAPNLLRITGMFYECPRLRSLSISGLYAPKLKEAMFLCRGDTELKEACFQNWNTLDTTEYYGLFMECSGLEIVDISGVDAALPGAFAHTAFDGCSSLKEVHISERDSVLAYQLPSIPLNGHAGWWSRRDGAWYDSYGAASRSVGDVLVKYPDEPTSLRWAQIQIEEPVVYAGSGRATEPSVSVTLSGMQLVEGVDYTVQYDNNTSVGTANALVVGTNNYTGTLEKSYVILPANIANASVTIPSQRYDGAAKEPPISIAINGAALEESVDYEVHYMNNVDVGIATAQITGVGNYEGSITATFHIVPSDSFFTDCDPADDANHGVEVDWMGRSGISTGWEVAGGREFRGRLAVTRCDFAAFLYRMADLSDDGARNDSCALPEGRMAEVLAGVSDCDERTPHAAEVAWMVDSGISRGWQDKGKTTVSFRPMANVARQDMAAFLYRFADLQDDGRQDKSLAMGPEPVTFSDVRHGDEANHAGEVEWLASVGVTKGWQMKDGTYQFRGTRTVARQDMAAFMYRLNAYLRQ